MKAKLLTCDDEFRNRLINFEKKGNGSIARKLAKCRNIFMRLKNILIVVRDIKRSKKFYKDLFGLDVVTDFGDNVILTEGLVLQEQKIWENFIEKNVVFEGNDTALYFEENDLDRFIEKLESSNYPAEYLNPCMEHDWGQRFIRIYDPDKHVIEIGEAMGNRKG